MATADTYPHIGLANDGKAVIEGTRYTVEHIAAEQYFYGWSAEEILRQHPDLRPAEVYAALAYSHDHHDSIVAAIESGKARAERARGPEPVSRDELFQDLVAHDVQTNHLGGLCLVEVILHRGSHVRPQFVKRIGLGEDRLANRPRGKATFGGFIHHENDLDHGHDRQKRIGAAAPRRHVSRSAPKNVGATRDVRSLMRQHLRETPEKSTGLCPYPFPFQIWFDGDAVRARSASRRRREGS